MGFRLKPRAHMKINLLSILALAAFSVTAVPAAQALDEQQFQKLMKEVGKAAKAMKDNAQAKNAAVVVKDSTRTAAIFKQMAAFWKVRHADDAAALSEKSSSAASATAAAAKAGDWNGVKSNWGTVGQNCKTCHEKHREKLDDGSFRIK